MRRWSGVVFAILVLGTGRVSASGPVELISKADPAPPPQAAGVSEAPSLSADGRYVAFANTSSNLVPGQNDANLSSTPDSRSTTNVGALSRDGKYVAFASFSAGVVAGMIDANGEAGDVFLRDRTAGTTTLVSHNFSSATTTGNLHSLQISVSGDGAWAAFESFSTDIVSGLDPGPSFGDLDVFLFERATGTNTLVSHAPGAPTQSAEGSSEQSRISADGNYVLFSNIGGLVVFGQAEGNSGRDLFLYSRATGQNILVSRNSSSATTTGNGRSEYPALSDNGGYVAFLSKATDLVAGQVNNNADFNVYLFDPAAETTTLVSHASSSLTATGDLGVFIASLLSAPAISTDGAYVAFTSVGTNHVAGQIDTNLKDDVFLWERATGAITLVSRAAGSDLTAGNAASNFPSISADGRYVVFESNATDLVPEQTDTNSAYDVFLFDRITGVTTLVSHVPGSATMTGPMMEPDQFPQPSMSADGSAIAFFSNNPSLMGGQIDSNGSADLFIHDRVAGTNRLLSHVPGSNLMAPNAGTDFAQISADGSTVAFHSEASDIVADDYNEHADVFVHDRPELDYYTLTPCRLLDTREPQDGPALVSGVTEIVVLTGACGTPPEATALALNVTVTQASGEGFLTLYPGDFLFVPETSTINFQAGQTRSSNAFIPLAGDGTMAIFPFLLAGGSVHVIVDVTGYFVAGGS